MDESKANMIAMVAKASRHERHQWCYRIGDVVCGPTINRYTVAELVARFHLPSGVDFWCDDVIDVTK